MKNFIVWN